MGDLFKFLDGWKTYISAAGFAGYSLYLFSQGEYDQAMQALLAALAALGIRSAIAKAVTEQKAMIAKMNKPQ